MTTPPDHTPETAPASETRIEPPAAALKKAHELSILMMLNGFNHWELGPVADRAALTASREECATLRREVEMLRELVKYHHEWHLNQTDLRPVFMGDEIGQIDADAYQDSQLCEDSVSALNHQPETKGGDTALTQPDLNSAGEVPAQARAESDTPRTDIAKWFDRKADGDVVYASCAEQLERELTVLRQQLAEAEQQRDKAMGKAVQYRADFETAAATADKFNRELRAAQSEAATLLERVRELEAWQMDAEEQAAGREDEFLKVRAERDAAQAACAQMREALKESIASMGTFKMAFADQVFTQRLERSICCDGKRMSYEEMTQWTLEILVSALATDAGKSLAEDRARLDWLETCTFTLYPKGENEGHESCLGHPAFDAITAPTVRAAIDLARGKQG